MRLNELRVELKINRRKAVKDRQWTILIVKSPNIRWYFENRTKQQQQKTGNKGKTKNMIMNEKKLFSFFFNLILCQ